MERDERRRADDLDRHWDDILGGVPTPPPAGPDADLAELIDRLQAAVEIPLLFPDRRRAWRELRQRVVQTPPVALPTTGTVEVTPGEFNRNGRVEATSDVPPTTRIPPPARSRALAQWALAALVVLTLVAGLLVLRVVRPGWVFPPSEPLVETLLDATIETGGTPGSWVPIAVERWTFAPGPATLTVLPLAGPQWVVADGGTLIATVGGVEQRVESGRALLVEVGQELVLRNGGAGEAAAIRGVASAGFASEEFDRSAISTRAVLETVATKALPAGASRVVFLRLTMPPGSALPPAATGELDWFGVVSGRLGLTLAGEALPAGWKGEVEREVAALERLPRLVPGTSVTLRNAGEEPLVLLRLTVLAVDQVTSEPGQTTAAAPGGDGGIAELGLILAGRTAAGGLTPSDRRGRRHRPRLQPEMANGLA